MNAPLSFPPRPGRPRLEEELGTPYLAIVQKALDLKQKNPHLSYRKIAEFHLNLDPPMLYRYMSRYKALLRQGKSA